MRHPAGSCGSMMIHPREGIPEIQAARLKAESERQAAEELAPVQWDSSEVLD